MKYLLMSLGLLMCSTVYSSTTDTPQSILKKAGYKLLLIQKGKEIYIRPKDIKVSEGIVFYSATEFYTKSIEGVSKYSLKADYRAISCKENKAVLVKTQVVPYFGRSFVKDYTKKGNVNIQEFNAIDKIIASKMCNLKVV